LLQDFKPLFIYLTEQETIPRPIDKTRRRRRKEYYFSKKKRHIVKTQYRVNKKREILPKSKHHTRKENNTTIQYPRMSIQQHEKM